MTEKLPVGWIEHDGGPCPVDPHSFPSVIYRDGERPVRQGDARAWALRWEWNPDYGPDDIIAYKPED